MKSVRENEDRGSIERNTTMDLQIMLKLMIKLG
jgi:hypothetical protein